MKSLVLPGALESLALVQNYVTQAASEAALDRRQTLRLNLALAEIATNVITEGYDAACLSGDLYLQARMEAGSLTIVLEDTGAPLLANASQEENGSVATFDERPVNLTGNSSAVAGVDLFTREQVDERNRYTFVVQRHPVEPGLRGQILTEDEKIELLKRVSIFAQIPPTSLPDLVAHLAEVLFRSGETIFTKGDVGAHMYIIVQGRVRVHDGARTLNNLSIGDVFGEMALLETEPRMASVSAAQDTWLLRLDQEDLFQLLNRRSEVALGILRVLSHRLRARVHDLNEVRMQLERVILPLGIALSTETNVDRLLERISVEAQGMCQADAALLFLRSTGGALRCTVARIGSLNLALGGTTGRTVPIDPVLLPDPPPSGEEPIDVLVKVALTGQSINLADVARADEFDITAVRRRDRALDYRTVTALTAPLKNHASEVIGVLQLINARDPVTHAIVGFDTYQQLIVESLASQAAVALNTQMLLRRQEELMKLEIDLQVGRRIQADFLPETLPQPPGWEIVARFEPAREVAGDFYDAYPLPDGRIGFVVADVCDKGVGAALFMALSRSLIRAFGLLGVKTGDKQGMVMSSAETLAFTNDYMATTHRNMNMFVTLFLGVLDPVSGVLTYINAGHNPPFLMRADGSVKERLKPSGPAVGMFAGATFATRELLLEPGDLLFAFTDGVPEAHNAARELYTDARLEGLLSEPTSSAEAVVQKVEDELIAFVGDEPHYDDVTMMAVYRKVVA